MYDRQDAPRHSDLEEAQHGQHNVTQQRNQQSRRHGTVHQFARGVWNRCTLQALTKQPARSSVSINTDLRPTSKRLAQHALHPISEQKTTIPRIKYRAMKLLPLATLLLAAVPATFAREINRPCDQEGGFTCSLSMKEILVCLNRRWQLSAPCDGPYCVKPVGATVPWCQPQ